MTWQPTAGTNSYGTAWKANSNTLTVTLQMAPQSLTVLALTFDNASATTPTVTSIYKPAGETANWQLLCYHDSNQASGGGGVRTEVWGIIPQTTSAPWASNYAVTLSQAVTAKAWAFQMYAGGPETLVVGSPVQGIASSATISTTIYSLTGRQPEAGELVIIAAGIEGTSYPPQSLWTGYQEWRQAYTEGQGATSNVVHDFRAAVSAGGDEGIVFDTAGDKGICGVVIAAGPPAPPADFGGTGTLQAHKTRYPDLVPQISTTKPLLYYRFRDPFDRYNVWPKGTVTDWYVTDSSPWRRHADVYPSGTGGNYTPGAPMPHGIFQQFVPISGSSNNDDKDDVIQQRLQEPGLVFGGDTGQDFSLNPQSRWPASDRHFNIYVTDPRMQLAGGGRYLSPTNEGGPQRLTLTAIVNLEAYPVDNAGAPTSATLMHQSAGRYYIRITGAGKLELNVMVRHGSYDVAKDFRYVLTGNTPLTLFKTHHIAYTFDGSFLRLFIDGVKDAEMPLSYQDGTTEIQKVTIAGSPTGGTFTLTFNGQTTGPIPHNATGDALKVALEGLSNINPGDVVIDGQYADVGGAWYWQVYFYGQYDKVNVALMSASGAGLTGGTSPTATVTLTREGVTGTLYTSGNILWTSGTGGTNGGDRTWWEPGDEWVYLLTEMPASRVDEIAFWATGLTEAQILDLATASKVDSPGAAVYGWSALIASRAYQDEVQAGQPGAWWRLNDAPGATTMTDSSGNARHGSYVGTPALAQPSLIADTDNKAMIPSAAGGSAAHGGTYPYEEWMFGENYTYEVILKPLNFSSYQTVALWPGDPVHRSYIDQYARFYWEMVYDASTMYSVQMSTGENSLVAGQTSHVVLVAEGLVRRIYLNGKLKTTTKLTSKPPGNPAYPIKIGHGYSGTFRGTIDEVSLYPYAVSDEVVAARYRGLAVAPARPVADLKGTGALTADSRVAYVGSVEISGSGDLAAVAGQGYFARPDYDGAGLVAAQGAPTFVDTPGVAGGSFLTVRGLPRWKGAADLSGSGELLAQAFRPIQRVKPKPQSEDVAVEETSRTRFWR